MRIFNTKNEVIFESTHETLKETLENAVSKGVNLKGVNLEGAILK